MMYVVRQDICIVNVICLNKAKMVCQLDKSPNIGMKKIVSFFNF